MDNADKYQVVDGANGVQANFTVIGSKVLECDLIGVIENGDGLFKCDVVLGQITGCFPLIPLELHQFTINDRE